MSAANTFLLKAWNALHRCWENVGKHASRLRHPPVPHVWPSFGQDSTGRQFRKIGQQRRVGSHFTFVAVHTSDDRIGQSSRQRTLFVSMADLEAIQYIMEKVTLRRHDRASGLDMLLRINGDQLAH